MNAAIVKTILSLAYSSNGRKYILIAPPLSSKIALL